MFITNLLRVKKCCGCVSLQTGSLIIGYMETVGNLYGLINTLITSETFEEIITYIPISIFLILINTIMIYGVHREKKKLLLPWMLTRFLACLAITIFFAMQSVETFLMIPDFIDFKYKLIALLLSGAVSILLLLLWYSFICVYSLYSLSSVSDVTDKTGKKNQ